MKIYGNLKSATFVERPNRFITLVEIDGVIFRSHLPDPGRLAELLVPGTELLVMPTDNTNRKTSYTTVMVKRSGQLISLVSTLPNYFIRESLINKKLEILHDYKLVKPEIKVENHRFDFLLADKKDIPFYLEIKSVTYVKEGIAKFPDAVTKRGREHAKVITHIVLNGGKAGILFVCQRPDAFSFQPMWDRDPKFSKALLNSYNAGVKIWCITLNISESEITFNQEIPVNLTVNI